MKKSTRHRGGRRGNTRPAAAASTAETLVLLPVGPDSVHVYWQLAEGGAPAAAQLSLRFHEQGGGGEVVALTQAAAGMSGKCYVSLPPDRDYRAEAGWLGANGDFAPLARSNCIRTLPLPAEEATVAVAPSAVEPRADDRGEAAAPALAPLVGPSGTYNPPLAAEIIPPAVPAQPAAEARGSLLPAVVDESFWSGLVAELLAEAAAKGGLAADRSPASLAAAAMASRPDSPPAALLPPLWAHGPLSGRFADLTAMCEAKFRGGISSHGR